MTVSDALRLVKRWWWVLVVAPVLGAVVAYLVSQTLTPKYEASTLLLIQQSQTPGSPNYQDVQASQQLTGTYSAWIVTTPVLDAAAKTAGIPGGAEAIQKQISVSPVTNTQLVSVSVTDPSPEQAAKLANAIATVFIDQTRSQQTTVTGNSLDEIQQNIDQVKKQIDDTAAKISQLQATPVTGAVDQAQITSLQQQLSQFQTTYGTLIEAQQRMAIQQAQIGAQVSVLQPATAPRHPVSPRITLNTALGGMLGLILGFCALALLGYLDNTVKSSDDVRALTGAGALGLIPTTAGITAEGIIRRPRSGATEALRALRTNLQFTTANQGLTTIAVTSARPQDGKSMTSMGLAVVLAQGGQHVALVDADLRKPSQHRLLDSLHNRSGLTNLLRSANMRPSDVWQETGIDGLHVITSGPIPTNPPDLLDSARMREVVTQLRGVADVVIIDTPPVGISDPLIVAGMVDAVLVVVAAGQTRKKEMSGTLERIAMTGVPVVGIVLNRVDLHHEGYYYGYQSDTEIEEPRNERDSNESIEESVTSPTGGKPASRRLRSAAANKR